MTLTDAIEQHVEQTRRLAELREELEVTERTAKELGQRIFSVVRKQQKGQGDMERFQIGAHQYQVTSVGVVSRINEMQPLDGGLDLEQ